MKKVTFAEFGGPDVLRLVDAAEPHAGPGQVRIAVRAAGVNPADWRAREGQFGPVTFPAEVGLDAAGVIDEVGAGVEDVEAGDRVFGFGTGTYAEFAVLTAWARMPEGLTFGEAAGYPSVVETALRILRQVGVRSGETLLVSGAAGGVGSAVLQIARDRGIAVIGTASAANQDYLRSLGAVPTTYGEGWAERVRHLATAASGRRLDAGSGRGFDAASGRRPVAVDAALDLAGAGVLRELVELTGDPHKVISIADMGPPELGVRFSGEAENKPEALAEAARLIAQGKLRIPVDKSYPLADAATAQIDSRAGHTRGRRVLLV
ncbi:oxidoreductase [Actinoplanes sp. NBRC 14428]|uniref:NADPH:quinone reductase-like Zn-dependent oxidoreductase n=1 Tax=Pseudosporangium ferrugineum TaxID=439699 RepID=A0A2T0S3S2_9ACTN|nr:NADP-dependent oxidoreductase [Pseudosporangium ferrugineum]PRY28047.1 NADPH:quinone reductase-like Zn-dependent oxidoreductase [Pseudosporangium ferrugineum]BCJ52170.1 oxidoreductase [Actinoplanes sp. NBRC 14428]